MTDDNANKSGVGENNVTPNVNCLDGKQCPNCRSFGPFEIEVSMRVLLRDDGIDDAEDSTVEYDDDSPAACCACRYEGKFGTFDTR
jgi:hypothetical protein